MPDKEISNSMILSDQPTKDELDRLHESLHEFNRSQTDGNYDLPGVEINMIARDQNGTVVGGVSASTVLKVMHLEVLWVAKEYRKFGLASKLVLGAERIGAGYGCLTTQTMSFSFQAPGFYQKIGYEVLGVYTGYPFGITETILNKPLNREGRPADSNEGMLLEGHDGLISFTEEVTEEDLKSLHNGLHAHVVENIGDRYKGKALKLVLRDRSGRMVGGLTGFTTINNLILESMWIEEEFRRAGLGTKLLAEAESIAIEDECTACQTMSLSFQAPDFFLRHGYETFAVSEGYPDPFREFYFIKQFD